MSDFIEVFEKGYEVVYEQTLPYWFWKVTILSGLILGIIALIGLIHVIKGGKLR